MQKKVFITGASAGFGEEMARLFAQEGYLVIASARRKARLEALAAQYEGRILPLALDVTNKEEVASLPDMLPTAWRDIDILINNAGLAAGLDLAPFVELEDWEKMIDTNIKGLVRVTHALLPGMVVRHNGHIMNIGSTAGQYPYPGSHVYGASKAFVHQFSLNLRADLAGTAIRVTNIQPGLCGETEFSHIRFKGDKEKVTALYQGVAYLTPQDIARTALWIAQQPPHVNVNSIELMPVAQSFAGLSIHRGPLGLKSR